MKWVDHGQGQRSVQLFQPVWSPGGSKAFLEARAADNKDEWLLALDTATGKTRVLSHDHDDTWVKRESFTNPGMSTAPGWMNNGREIYFVSERTGYAQIYAVGWDGGEPRALTSGKWEVLGLR